MKTKRIFLAAIVAALLLVAPLHSVAQVFLLDGPENPRIGTGDGIEGIWGNANVVDYEDDTYLPLGNGLWILAAAAGIYLIVRSMKSRKAATLMVAAMALALGTTQCRKASEPEKPTEKTIHITLKGGNGSGTKTDVNVYTGRITWNSGDEVYAVCNNATNTSTSSTEEVLLGSCLTAQADGNVQSTLQGDLSIPSGYTIPATGAEFVFYYVGRGVDFTPAAGDTELQFNIADQSGTDAGEYMIGRTEVVLMDEYDAENHYYQPSENPTKPRTFKPLTAVLWLDSHVGFGDCAMTMNGVQTRNAMTITLSDAAVPAYTTGTISFAGGNNAQISVLPTNPVGESAALTFNGASKSGIVTVKNGIKAGNVYVKLCDGGVYPIPVVTSEGILPGLFSVSEDKKVRFSSGNLQYIGSGTVAGETATPPYWRFATNQWDYIGSSGLSYITGAAAYNNSTENNAVRDLFGWGTSGLANTSGHCANCWQPWSTSSNVGDYYVYGHNDANLYDYEGNADWGFNAIVNGGSTANLGWRTLKQEEMTYMLNSRTGDKAPTIGSETDARFAAVQVNSIKGMMIFPDEFEWPAGAGSQPTVFNTFHNTWNDVNYTTEQFALLESAGVVFLPAAGKRVNKTSMSDVGDALAYHESSRGTSAGRSYRMQMTSNDYNPNNGLDGSCDGLAVRLVVDEGSGSTINAAINENYEIGPALDWGD